MSITQTKFPKTDAAIVPLETPAQKEAAGDYGPNNEYLPERLQEALRRLVFQFSTESESTRRQEIRRIKQAHQFWRGLQYLWWNERDQNWHLPFQEQMLGNSSLDSMPRYEFVTNIYQAFGLSLVAVLGGLATDKVNRLGKKTLQFKEAQAAAVEAAHSPDSTGRSEHFYLDSGTGEPYWAKGQKTTSYGPFINASGGGDVRKGADVRIVIVHAEDAK